MTPFDLMRELAIETPSKIVLLVSDGLGGLPNPATGRSELESAFKPNLDRLAERSICGLTDPIAPGITPGSGPSHLALFGYDPIKYDIGRGVLEALGIDFDLQPNDVASRGNFITLGPDGTITDRRAGRLQTEKAAELCALLQHLSIAGAEAIVRPVRDYRFVVVFRGAGLSDALSESDPQRVGERPRRVRPLAPEAQETAALVNTWIDEASKVLAGHAPANGLVLRGFAKHPDLPPMSEVYKLRAAAIAVYPMYRGLAKLVGMTVLPTGQTFGDELDTLREHWHEFDFFYLHYKKTDSAGEDGDFDRKVAAIEELDQYLPRLLDLEPDVLIITGDHSTPAVLAAHSWHPVPLLLANKYVRPDESRGFNERECAQGSIGRIPAQAVMPLAMAHALKLAKYGA